MSFLEVQHAFMAHLRDPEQHPAPTDVEDRRMAIYRRLFINNIDGFLSSSFPVLKSLYAEGDWQQLVRRFYADHDCHSPLFLDISEAFLDYLDGPAFSPRPCDPPFMAELAHYEWLELAVGRSEDEGTPVCPDIDTPLRLCGAAALAAYHWPVHQISSDFRPDAPLAAPVFLLVYRGPDDKVAFMLLSSAMAQALSLIEQSPGLSAKALVGHLAAPGEEQRILARQLLAALGELADKGALLGA